jgi:hypothetical protein
MLLNYETNDLSAVRICCFTQAMAESLGWRFQPWIEPILERDFMFLFVY